MFILNTKMINKSDALKIVANDGFLIYTLPLNLQHDYDIITTAIKQSYFSFVQIPFSGLNNEIMAFVFNNEYQEYYDEILHIINYNNHNNILQNVNYNLKNNKILIEILFLLNSKTLCYASEEILDDKIFILHIVKKYKGKYGKILKYLSNNLKDDDEVVFEIINTEFCASNFKYASDRLKDNFDFVYKAIDNCVIFINHVTDRIKDNYEFILKGVQNDGLILEFASDRLKNNYIIVYNAIKNCGNALQYASNELKDNYYIVYNAVKNCGDALEYASDELKDNKKIVLTAVKKSSYALEFASLNLRDNEKIVSNAIKDQYCVFEYISTRLKTNKKFICYLLQKNINIIKFLDNYYDNDDIINIIINNINNVKFIPEKLEKKILLTININSDNIDILNYISEDLLDNKEIMLPICQKNNEVFNYISDSLKNDDDFLMMILKIKPTILSESFLKNNFNSNFICKIFELNLFSYLPDKIKKKYNYLYRILNKEETNINKILDIFLKNIDSLINNVYILNIIFNENLKIFEELWYKNKNVRNKFLEFIENNETLSIILAEYNIIFENIKIFDETLDISDINNDRFINIKQINEFNMKKKIIYY